jgi:single-stranded DNA-binding protein
VFHRVICYGALAEYTTQSQRRGGEVVVIGRLVDDSYDRDGHRQRRIILAAQLPAASPRCAIARPVKANRRPTTPGQPQQNTSA